MSVSRARRRPQGRRTNECKHAHTTTTATVTSTSTCNKKKKLPTSKNKKNEISFCVMTLNPDFHTQMTYDAPIQLQDAIMNINCTAFVTNDMVATRRHFDSIHLCHQSQLVLTEPNAGGASEKSEALSFELLKRAFGCQLLKTEMKIGYEWEGWSKKTDYLCSLFNTKIGVSVTRAMAYHRRFTDIDAYHLLCKKLYGVQMSSRDVIEDDRWCKQLLHIWCAEEYMVRIIQRQYKRLCIQQPNLVGNTVILVTRTHNAPFIYTNK